MYTIIHGPTAPSSYVAAIGSIVLDVVFLNGKVPVKYGLVVAQTTTGLNLSPVLLLGPCLFQDPSCVIGGSLLKTNGSNMSSILTNVKLSKDIYAKLVF